MSTHYVTFMSPGTFFTETTQQEIERWDVEEAKKRAKKIMERHNATPYGFQFKTVISKTESKYSPMYFLGGKVETLAQVKKRATKDDAILIRNMEANDYKKVITNTNSWKVTLPVQDEDVVLPWPE